MTRLIISYSKKHPVRSTVLAAVCGVGNQGVLRGGDVEMVIG
jgi:hypothetical protein